MRWGTTLLSCTRGNINFRVWLPREIRVVPPIRVVCITVRGIRWWLVLAHDIGMLCHHIPYLRNHRAVFTLVVSGLAVEARLDGYRSLFYCPYLM